MFLHFMVSFCLNAGQKATIKKETSWNGYLSIRWPIAGKNKNTTANLTIKLAPN